MSARGTLLIPILDMPTSQSMLVHVFKKQTVRFVDALAHSIQFGRYM
jgi:hypothetical protein